MAFLKGILTGLTTLVFVGPVFFTLLKNALQRGTMSGVLTALGILISDIVVLLICYFLAADLINEYINAPIVKFIAASILLAFGVVFFIKPVKQLSSSEGAASKGLLKSFSQGFLVNFANPTVFVVWIGFAALAHSMYAETTSLLLYFVGILTAIFVTDTLKSIGASKLKPYLKSSYLSGIFKIIGLLVAGTGIYLAYQGFAQLM